jgi:subtilase family serine protease
MRPISRVAAIAAGATLVIGGLALAAPAMATTTPAVNPAPARVAGASAGSMRSCSAARSGASCKAVLRTGASPNAASPTGLNPPDLQSAYKLPSSTAGAGQTVAIVDAFDDPNAEADLGVYRSQFHLPSCTTANGCFRKVNQNGAASPLPAPDGGWAEEISLDIDMVSAICPNCHILLVEANSPTFANLGAAVNRAATMGANAISNSYGGSDTSDASANFYNHPGIAVTASSGDSGFGVEFPASSRFVTAVGGTSLTRASNARGWSETAWSGAGSGCSRFNTALSGAATFNTGCSRRAVADVSAVADPATGVSVFDSFAFQGFSGWLTFGGTSVSAPIVASVFALAGNASSTTNNFPYQHSGSLFDVTSGSNGSCSPAQLCTARVGWDGPTGLGTPNGTGAF